MPSASDIAPIKFGFAVQNLLFSYYKSVPVNETFFSSLSNDPVPRTDFLANFMGLQQQAKLGVDALQQFSSKLAMNDSMPMCDYSLPAPADAQSHLMNAYQMEATLCGTFIGLADYVYSPEASFLMARLSAEHGIHASYIGSHMKSQVFMANSTSLTPAFTPEHVMRSNMSIGHLGNYIKKCTSAPPAPCGGRVEIGNLGANLTGTNTTMAPTMN
ncbi:hypothetical protein N7497_003718 [Penicillium chrysogenum]|nr:hypothetical protein N7497_003718 [Penicillium chrysogenum]